MGPILQEQALKGLTAKDKLRVKNAENHGALTTGSKKGSKMMNQNCRPVKKSGGYNKNVPDKDMVPRTERTRANSDLSPVIGNRKLPRAQAQAESKSQLQKHVTGLKAEDKRNMHLQPKRCGELHQSLSVQGMNRHGLSLPLAPQAVLQQGQLREQISSLGSMELFEHREDDTDSASDLSDSERLPVLPSPCTPPQLNLRAEVIDSVDLRPQIPGPKTEAVESDSYSYSDFLPPPFNTWSLRQLAIFLNTEGKGAPRPRPVGQLEKFLERLLQLEWHQMQTIQAENGRPTVPIIRPKGHVPSAQLNASRPRPHTAPPSRLSSPKSLRQGHRAFPFTALSSLTSPSSTHLSRPICPYCHVRYPLCNGTCYSYAYQRHSRLSPLLERKNSTPATQKRSSSESRAAASESKANARAQNPTSPQTGWNHLKNVQATIKLCTPSQDFNGSRKSRAGRVSETNRQCASAAMRSGAEKRTPPSGKQDVGLMRRCDKDGLGAESGRTKPATKRTDNGLSSKKTSSARPNGKVKNVQFLVK
ncbi:uncharacterized protein fam217ba [Denticeps clupeoides]|uniref:Uncharacterized protein n=1 Tax=Denticeps clupeoides TaxID=299321 RepID=A0AAY4B903_9TELE|nr:uncharacterized protein LOC114798112 [Denticeps clupeoides]